MKMNDIVEGAMDDFGLGDHGRELVKDIDPNKEVFKNKQVSVQLKNILDYPKGGTVKTDDGKSVPVSQKQAQTILSKGYIGLAPVLGIKPKYARDPDAKDEVMKQMQMSAGLEKILAGI